ncbi:MAG TPA: ABC transporter permease [Bacteroidia bacterium]|nr:ABC transporter permease [Bacteroidia bacterium]HNT80499.1 ABC transporter permease [Bacteroidia bacterium]
MFKNYIKIVFRNIIRSKLYSLITIIGLAIGICCFAFIALFVKDELSYDSFHNESYRLYRITETIENKGQGEHSSSVPFPVAKEIEQKYPHIFDQVVRLFNNQEPYHTLRLKNTTYSETSVFYADKNFFEVFNYDLTGDKATCLLKPNSVVLSKDFAQKCFGYENPIGKTIEFEGNTQLTITAIADTKDKNSHFSFNALIAFETLGEELKFFEKEWVWNPCWTYVKVNENYDSPIAEAALQNIISDNFPQQLKNQTQFFLQPVTNIHLHSQLAYEIQKNGSYSSLLILGTIALLVLVIAGINFINLTTVRSISRAREIGIRKVNGAYKESLFLQFFFESIVLSGLSILISISLCELLLPIFNELANKNFSSIDIYNTWTLSVLISIGLLTGALSGIIPSLIMSKYDPLIVLKGNTQMSPESSSIRRWLVIYQFAVSIVLLICTGVIYKQLNFMQQADLGFDQNEVLVIPTRSSMHKEIPAYIDSIKNNQQITQVTVINDLLGRQHNTSGYKIPHIDTSNYYYFPALFTDLNIAETFNMQIIAGRDFSDAKGDDSLSVLINESMLPVINAASPKEALGIELISGRRKKKIIGVVKNFHFTSLQNPIGPFIIDIPPARYKWYFTKYIAVRVDQNNFEIAISDLESKWSTLIPEIPFTFSSMHKEIISQYGVESRLAKLAVYFSLLAIIIACLGLFALSAFTANQRTREIGIRKVLGASIYNITKMLSLEYLKLVIIANMMAWPCAYFIMNHWLDNFAFHISLDINVFLIASGIALIIALITVTSQSLKAAIQNPIHAISYE